LIIKSNSNLIIAKDDNTIDSATQKNDPTRTIRQDVDKAYKEIQVKQESYQNSLTTVN
jgi:hypothetical protein